MAVDKIWLLLIPSLAGRRETEGNSKFPFVRFPPTHLRLCCRREARIRGSRTSRNCARQSRYWWPRDHGCYVKRYDWLDYLIKYYIHFALYFIWNNIGKTLLNVLIQKLKIGSFTSDNIAIRSDMPSNGIAVIDSNIYWHLTTLLVLNHSHWFYDDLNNDFCAASSIYKYLHCRMIMVLNYWNEHEIILLYNTLYQIAF